MKEKVIIELGEKDLIKIIAKHFDLQEPKTSLRISGSLITVESDRVKQSEITKAYSQYDR